MTTTNKATMFHQVTKDSMSYVMDEIVVSVGPYQYIDDDAATGAYVATGLRIATVHMQLVLDAAAVEELRTALYMAITKQETRVVRSTMQAPHRVHLEPKLIDTCNLAPSIRYANLAGVEIER